MIEQNQIDQIDGSTVYDTDGNKIGKAGQVYLDDQTGDPAWVTVNTGLFGTSESFIPLSAASLSGDGLTVPYGKDKVKDAPNVSADGHLSPDEERELYAYYDLSGSYDTSRDSDDTTDVSADYDRSETRSTDDDGAMTLSEERVEVGTQSKEAGRVRLRKYVVTENVTQTVPVRKEKAVLEREPITDSNVGDATSGADISEAEHDVVLHEESPVVQKTVEPVERVRLGTEEVQSEETITEEVRKERIETDGDIEGNVDRDDDRDDNRDDRR